MRAERESVTIFPGLPCYIERHLVVDACRLLGARSLLMRV